MSRKVLVYGYSSFKKENNVLRYPIGTAIYGNYAQLLPLLDNSSNDNFHQSSKKRVAWPNGLSPKITARAE